MDLWGIKKGITMRSEFKKLTYEDKFDRKFACWANNHDGWSKAKKQNRKEARQKLKEELKKELERNQYV